MVAGIVSTPMKGNQAKRLTLIVVTLVTVMSAATLFYVISIGDSFIYTMGKYPAPWGNEIRAGVLESMLAMVFSLVMLFSLLGGMDHVFKDVPKEKINLYFILNDLLLSSLLAIIYTNDLFTGYVFVEINTIAACGLIMIRQNGRTIEAAVRYMIMSLLGSGLLLLGLCMLYDLTGHLLMSNMKESVARLAATGQYEIPLIVAIVLISVGICIKSALFPFHAWLPDAYGYSTVSSAAILSSLVSKGYIFLLIKIIYRVIGFDIYGDTRIIDVLFAFGLMGMIFGSLSAIKENDVRRMIAYSSVAQIGYIYMGFGMGTEAGMTASVFHILSHAATKSLLFIAAIGLTDVSGGSRKFIELTGAGYRNKWAGAAFTVGSLSMVGMPLFSGFISKLLFAQAAVQNHVKMLPALIVLGVSTILNAIYFMKTVIRIYTPVGYSAYPSITFVKMRVYAVTLVAFILLNVILGISSQPVVDMIRQGLAMFS